MIYLFLSKAFYDSQKLNAISAIDLLRKNKTNSPNDPHWYERRRRRSRLKYSIGS